MMSPQSRIYLAMLVEIWSYRPRAVILIQEQNHALSDIDEKADVAATSICC